MLPTKRRESSNLPSLFSDYPTLWRHFDSLFDRFFGTPLMEVASHGVDIYEDDDHVYVELEAPGYKKDEIDVTLENGVLTIRGRKEQTQEKKGEYYVRERRTGQFARSFTLPSTVDENKVKATLRDGILTVVLDKSEQMKPRKIEVSD